MEVDLSPEHLAFRDRVRQYMSERMMTADFQAELKQPQYAHGGGPLYWEKLRQLGADDWIRASWPKALGGGDADPIQQYLLVEEAKRVGFPWPALSANSIGPMVAKHAQPAVRDKVVGEILAGEAYLAIGYSEPNAGSDLANLRTRAVRDGDDWVINGQKIWTSCANFAQYIWLAARTDPDPARRHKGISIFLVPTDSPGYSCTPIETLGVGTTATYYQDVRVPDNHRIGELNGGWALITSQLNLERLSLANYGHVAVLYDQTLALLKTDPSCAALLAEPWVQRNLALAKVRLEALKLLCFRALWVMGNGGSGMVEASVTKVFGSELYVELGRLMNEILGPVSLLHDGSGVLAEGLIEKWYRKGSVHTFGGGANELQRNIIAQAGLGLPR
ncbi:acyl-CoA dehydrogenase family protein [Pseudomonas lopnurensis]|uniref:acyl-CoA dehydrogenase family protein n=1 Tax=Pseudomonas lopnurensis TaxID=1477517 RepID=UPI0028A88388|nr:acyl-CoA dehydrogenase family protein [Pseudomonas lopnurensis]